MDTQIQGTGSVSLEEIYQKLKDGQVLSTKISYSHPNKTNNISTRMSIGRTWLNILLPDDFHLVDYQHPQFRDFHPGQHLVRFGASHVGHLNYVRWEYFLSVRHRRAGKTLHPFGLCPLS